MLDLGISLNDKITEIGAKNNYSYTIFNIDIIIKVFLSFT